MRKKTGRSQHRWPQKSRVSFKVSGTSLRTFFGTVTLKQSVLMAINRTLVITVILGLEERDFDDESGGWDPRGNVDLETLI